jgi:hypothetical protein
MMTSGSEAKGDSILIRTCLVAIGIFIGSSLVATSWAHGPGDTPEGGFRALVGGSALIAHGRVTDVTYRTSEASKQQPRGVPHTFVTYELTRVYRGDQSTKRLTLRVPGGADGAGGVYLPTTSPMFMRGQEDVLFVVGGVIDGCPLVGCVEGRFRVVEGHVYNGWGVPVAEVGKRLRIGGKPRYELNVMELPTPAFEALIERPEIKRLLEEKYKGQSLKELKARYEKEAPKRQIVSYGSVSEEGKDKAGRLAQVAQPMVQFEGPVSLEQFAEAIQEVSRELGPPKVEVVMADPGKRFEVPPPTVARLEAKIEKPRIGKKELRARKTMMEGADGASGGESEGKPEQEGGER